MKSPGLGSTIVAALTGWAKAILTIALTGGTAGQSLFSPGVYCQESITLPEEMCPTQQIPFAGLDNRTSINLKILLVQFADRECRKDSQGRYPRYSNKDFENLLGSEGVYVSPAMYSPDGDELFGSMNDYYGKMSGGRLSISARVINRKDSVSGKPIWISLGRTKQYYQEAAASNSPIFTDALRAAEELGLDPSTSDDTKLAIVYAGNTYFQMGGLNPMAQGWCYTMSEVQGKPYNEEVNDARFSRIGIHCHEFAHTIGIGHSSGSRADVMCSGTRNGSVDGSAPAPFNAIVRMRRGWGNAVPVETLSSDSVEVFYSLTHPTIYTMKNGTGDMFLIENRRFDQTMTIGGTTVPDYNNVAFFPPAGPHVAISQGIFVWRLDTYGDLRDPGYSSEGLIYASGRYGRTYPENEPSETDDGVPFPGVSNNKLLSPWSDPRNPYLKEADFSNPDVFHYNLFVPNTKGGNNCAMEVLSEDRQRSTFRVRFYTSNPPNPELVNLPNFDSSGANNSRRAICFGDSGMLHQGLEIGGEIFYRRSTDGGWHWQATSILSTGNGGNSAPSITMAAFTVIAVWQMQASGRDTYVLHSRRSTDNGASWASIKCVGWSHGCEAPGPQPSIAGSPEGTVTLCIGETGQRWFRLCRTMRESLGVHLHQYL